MYVPHHRPEDVFQREPITLFFRPGLTSVSLASRSPSSFPVNSLHRPAVRYMSCVESRTRDIAQGHVAQRDETNLKLDYGG